MINSELALEAEGKEFAAMMEVRTVYVRAPPPQNREEVVSEPAARA